MLGDQQPQANQVAGDLVGQKLPHAPFQIDWIAGFDADVLEGPLRLDLLLISWTTSVEFFFEVRTLRSRVARCEC
jgi:hypothetical protein